eukprot:1831886-Rhodomonas_salina.1
MGHKKGSRVWWVTRVCAGSCVCWSRVCWVTTGHVRAERGVTCAGRGGEGRGPACRAWTAAAQSTPCCPASGSPVPSLSTTQQYQHPRQQYCASRTTTPKAVPHSRTSIPNSSTAQRKVLLIALLAEA